MIQSAVPGRPPWNRMERIVEYHTSYAVTGSPFENATSGRRWNVYVWKLPVIPPFATVGTSEARYGNQTVVLFEL